MKTARLPRTRTRIPHNDEFHPGTVVVPIDFSPLSTAALKKGRQITQQFGSKLHLIHAVEPVIRDAECILVPPELEEINQRLLAERKTRLESLRREATGTGIDCRAEVRFGHSWRVIVEYAKARRMRPDRDSHAW